MLKLGLLYNVFIPCFVVFTASSSLILNQTPNPLLLAITGAVLIASIALRNKFPARLYFFLMLVSLIAFHWYSHLNWCIGLYLIISATLFRTYDIYKSLGISLFFALLYTCVRLSYAPITAYNSLVSLYDLFAAVVVVLIGQYFKQSYNEKQSLKQDKLHLLTHDPLTNLSNYQHYYHELQLSSTAAGLIHILIECKNLKAMNYEHGIPYGNEILKKTSAFLQTTFPDAIAVSRYSGRKFAVALPVEGSTRQRIKDALESQLPQMLNLQVSYAMVVYPDEAAEIHRLFALAENRLFQINRENWLKQEEHMLRTEKLKAIGQLAAGMAHEIRNPLTAVKGFLQLAKYNGYSVEPWYLLMESEISRMSELTGEFLQFSKPHISNMKPIVLQDCIMRVIHLSESQALLLGHEVKFKSEAGPIHVNMDKDKIFQVILNLVKNGLEAMTETGVVIIRLFSEHNDAVLEIEDTGEGIAEEQLEFIFQPFYTTKEKGTGLGLSICCKIVQDHLGRLEVQSVLGQGTTFRIRLPIYQ